MARLKRQRLTVDGHEKVTASTTDDDAHSPGEQSSQSSLKASTEKPQGGRSLFVRSLPATATTETLTSFFSHSYPLKHATVVLDPSTKESKGYGFVTFADTEDAHTARRTFNGALFEGRKIKVEFAESRHRQESGQDIVKENTVSAGGREDRRQHVQPPSKLIVRNLPWTIKNEEQLATLFRSYGKVKHSTMPKKGGGLSAGFGFVTLRGRKNAEKALAGVNGREIDGRTLAVDWAVEKEVWEGLQNGSNDMEAVDAEAGSTTANGREDSVKSEDDVFVPVNDLPPSDVDYGVTTRSEDKQESEDKDSEDSANDEPKPKQTDHSIFVRNLPFTATHDSLRDHFSPFGPVKYARVVLDQATQRSKGTAFVCFFNKEHASACLQAAHSLRPSTQHSGKTNKRAGSSSTKQSLLEDTSVDPSGRFTVDGRVLQISQAVDRTEAARLSFANTSLRNARDTDRRRLYLLSEGTVSSSSPLFEKLSATELKVREDSAKQRANLIKNNPTLHISLTRLSVRNLPRSMTSKDLKALAREAAVGFAADVKARTRQQLSKEELSRGGKEMRETEKARKAKGKGIVKQAKIVFESREGGKVAEGSGAGRSRGYGFIEYTSHRWALMGLRWLNGHAVESFKNESNTTPPRKAIRGRMKRLIVEFAIENAQVVLRRHEREAKARARSNMVTEKRETGELPGKKKALSKDQLMARTRKGMKAEPSRPNDMTKHVGFSQHGSNDGATKPEKLVRRQQIIGRKRISRKTRNQGKTS